MTNEERLLSELGISNEYTDHSMKAILAYADEIRRECAAKAVRFVHKFGCDVYYFDEHGKDLLTLDEDFESAIIGKEATE